MRDDGSSATLHAIDARLYNNGGAKFDLTGPVMDRALFHVGNCYRLPNFRSMGTPHTAFGGFGGPQRLVVAEHIMDHLAVAYGIFGDRLRRDNMYTLEDSTPFGMRFGGEFTSWTCPVGRWETCRGTRPHQVRHSHMGWRHWTLARRC